MGHALGFSHEQDRPENASLTLCDNGRFPGGKTGTIHGQFDHDSIMDYCGPSNGILTERDKLGVRQIYARPDVHLAGTTSDGRLWHTLRHPDSHWEPFRDLEQVAGEIGTVTSVDLRYMRKGSVHLTATNSAGVLWHSVRDFNGNWFAFGDVKAAARGGAIGSVIKSSLADQGDALHLVAVTATGGIWHTIRQANGGWISFGNVKVPAGDPGSVKDVGISMDPFVGLHVCAVTTDGHLWHALRRPDTSWTHFVDVETVIGEIGTASHVDCTAISEQLHLVVSNTSGQLWHSLRDYNGNWTVAGNVANVAGNPGSVSDVAASQTKGELQIVVNANNTLYHAIRHASGAWTPLIDVKPVTSNPGSFNSVGME
jgi:hypothetical protein